MIHEVSMYPLITGNLLRDISELKEVTAVTRLLAAVSPYTVNSAEPRLRGFSLLPSVIQSNWLLKFTKSTVTDLNAVMADREWRFTLSYCKIMALYLTQAFSDSSNT
jgi:hypothetical protein